MTKKYSSLDILPLKKTFDRPPLCQVLFSPTAPAQLKDERIKKKLKTRVIRGTIINLEYHQ
jgi:hypothetical protein